MDIHVFHVKRHNIPNYIFPSGVRPSCPAKITAENKQNSKSRVSDHGQAERPQGATVVAVRAKDARKRKRSEDNMDNNSKNSKSPVSLPPPGMEVQEDKPPISASSSCSMKFDESEVNSMGGQKNKKLCLKSQEEITSGDSGTNGLMTSNQGSPLLAPADISNSKEEEKLAIEKIMSGPYDAHQAFPEEPEELEDNTECRNQVKDSGGNMKNNHLESSNSKPTVVEKVVISKETTCSTRLCSSEGLEELEPAELTVPLLSGPSAPLKKPLIRLNFTSLGKAANKGS